MKWSRIKALENIFFLCVDFKSFTISWMVFNNFILVKHCVTAELLYRLWYLLHWIAISYAFFIFSVNNITLFQTYFNSAPFQFSLFSW